MKNINILLVLFAVLTVFTAAFAQVPAELPAIDETAAEDFLGTWFMDQMCENAQCFSVRDFGMNAELELSADNTLTMLMGDEEPNVSKWYMEDGNAYMVVPSEDGDAAMEILIDEDGVLHIGDESTAMTFVRDEAIDWGSGEIVEDATYEDFKGEWYLYSITMGETKLPASLFGLKIRLTINEDTLSIEYPNENGEFGEPVKVPYELDKGEIYAVVPSTDPAGEPDGMVFVYHTEGAVSAENTGATATDVTGGMVFVREENLSSGGMNLMDMLSTFSEDSAAE